jgi:hypothetical protein
MISCEHKNTIQIGGQHRVPIFVGNRVEWLLLKDAGIVNEDIDSCEVLRNRRNQPTHALAQRHIGLHHESLATEGPDIGCGLLAAIAMRDIGDYYVDISLGKDQRNRTSDAAASAGYDGCFPQCFTFRYPGGPTNSSIRRPSVHRSQNKKQPCSLRRKTHHGFRKFHQYIV